MIKALFWDNDGVLVDTEKLYFKATREVLSEIGIDLTNELFAKISLKQGWSVFDHQTIDQQQVPSRGFPQIPRRCC